MKCQEFSEFKIGSAYKTKQRMYFSSKSDENWGENNHRLPLHKNSKFLVVDVLETTNPAYQWIEGLTFSGTVIWYYHTKFFQLEENGPRQPIDMQEMLEEICQ